MAERRASSDRLQGLPLVTLYLSERCNSRCVSCDWWRHGHTDVDLTAIERLLPSLSALKTRVALISGGEPLLHPQWADIARLLRAHGLKLWLLSSGLSLAKHAARAAELFDAITVSLDGSSRETYAAIRGLDAFGKVCEGIRAAVGAGAQVGLRVTVQRANYRELDELVEIARRLDVQQISFLAVDIASRTAFGRTAAPASDLALCPEDLPRFAAVLDRLESERAEDFASGLIAETPHKLRRIHQYFSALCGLASYPPVRCNVFDYSAVIGAAGDVRPCFFIPGPDPRPDPKTETPDLGAVLNGAPMMQLRESIRSGFRPECQRCVCSLWRESPRDAQEWSAAEFLMRRRARPEVRRVRA